MRAALYGGTVVLGPEQVAQQRLATETGGYRWSDRDRPPHRKGRSDGEEQLHQPFIARAEQPDIPANRARPGGRCGRRVGADLPRSVGIRTFHFIATR